MNNEEKVVQLEEETTTVAPEELEEVGIEATEKEEEQKSDSPTYWGPTSTSMKRLTEIADSYPTLSLEQEIELGRKMCAGDRNARKTLINCNMRYALQIAKIWRKRTYRTATSTSYDDIAQNALLGLIRGVDKYDPDKECKVVSFAVHDINDSVRVALDLETHLIRVPEWRAAHIHTIRHAGALLEQKLGRYPTAQEFYEYFEHRFPLQTIKDTLETASRRELTSLDAGIHPTASGSGAHDEEEIGEVMEILESRGLDEAAAEETDSQIASEAWEIIDTDPDITPQERTVADMLFKQQKTMKEIGVSMHVSKQRILEIEQRLIAKLRDKMKIKISHKDRAEARRESWRRGKGRPRNV